MNEKTKLGLHLFCVWSGVIFVVLLSLALILLAQFFPPPSPAMNAGEVVSMFADSLTGIRVAMILVMISAGFYMVSMIVVAHYVGVIEQGVGVLTLIVALAGAVNFVAFSLPSLWWLTAAFRLESIPEMMQLLTDMGWLTFLGWASPTMFLMFAVAVAAFVDTRKTPLFPRWFGYFNIWALTMFLPGQLIFFFKEGVFAWDGLVGFWLPAVDFFLQFLLTLYFVWKAIQREREAL